MATTDKSATDKSATDDATTDDTSPLAKAIGSIRLRNIGPAFMGGRIADIAIHPDRPSTWFLAVGSGGVWKTTNAGTTWTPVFDEQPSYSIGCVTIDPQQPDVVWVGTGEAVSGRHVGWGDGVYLSRDGGASWNRMGLDQAEHIAEILVDPRDSNVVYVAAEGPLWSAGGDRGVYKTTDGGASWQPVLQVDRDTGATSLAFAPGNPDVVYAATYQRRRRVWGFLGGGPGSGIHKSTDGGATWRRITQGLPEGDMGKIGLAVTPADPNIVYATIEADDETKGFYRSTDRGESWTRRSSYLSGGTGPHYYQEIFASPTNADRVYQVDVFVHWSADGGTKFAPLELGKGKHSDNHVVWIDPADGDHLLIGTDAGLYETFDHGATFRHFANLPISQFYRVAADNAEPFYNVLAGAQDLGTLYGPSRTTSVEGVRNQDWTVTLGADGYHVAFDPTDPNICYQEWQNGNVIRLDRRTMELRDIQPQGADDDPPERWNWDCPIVISPHDSNRVWVASHRVWRSDDRGDTWTAASPDLTRNLNRYELPIAPAADGGRVESVDALWDHGAMSIYSTITHLSESPVTPGVLYVGTDDGVVQASGDGGATWRQCELPDFPADGFINNVKASQHDDNVVFVVADAHKNGDYSPFVFVSDDRGATWRSISSDLPDGTIVWSIEQDHVDPDLLFLGTEFGVYVSNNAGANWYKLSSLPTISFRDIVLHRRDNDLVASTFGRGIYILDDYTVLRHLDDDVLDGPATVFPVRDAWWYVPHQLAQAPGQPTLGSSSFAAKNPDFGAQITYHLGADVQSPKQQRNESEKQARSDRDDINWPGWDALWDEHVADDAAVVAVIRDDAGSVVRRLDAATKAGLHTLTWDLRLAPPHPVKLTKPEWRYPWETDPYGPLVAPGTYTVELARVEAGELLPLTEAQPFFVKPTPQVASRPDLAETAAWNRELWQFAHTVLAAEKRVGELRTRVKERRLEFRRDAEAAADELASLEADYGELEDVARLLLGDPTRAKLSEPQVPPVKDQVGRLIEDGWNTTAAPSPTQRAMFAAAVGRFDEITQRLAELDHLR